MPTSLTHRFDDARRSMFADRNRPAMAFWTTVLVVGLVFLPMLYVASFGPACCLADRGILSANEISTAYPLIIHVMVEGSPLLREFVLGYASVCGGEDTATEVFLASVEFEAHYSD